MPKRQPYTGAIRALLAQDTRPARGQGGRGRLGDIARFLRLEAADVDATRREEGLTWDDVALAAARAGVHREDGTPYPGASFSRVWIRLLERKQIVLGLQPQAVAPDQPALPAAPPPEAPPSVTTSDPISEAPAPPAPPEPAEPVSVPARRARPPRHPEKATFGANVRAARERRELTQVELARLSGIGQPELSAVERGQANSTIDTMVRLANAVRVPLHRLLDPG